MTDMSSYSYFFTPQEHVMTWCSYTMRCNVPLGMVSSVQNLSQTWELITAVATQWYEQNMGSLGAEHSLRETHVRKRSCSVFLLWLLIHLTCTTTLWVVQKMEVLTTSVTKEAVILYKVTLQRIGICGLVLWENPFGKIISSLTKLLS